MRRISMFFMLLCAIVGTSALTAPGALAAHPAKPAPAPAGWSLVKGDQIKGAESTQNGRVRTLRSTANDRYVAAELGRRGEEYGMLRARATKPRTWEKFDLLWDDESNAYALRSRANGRYVSVELGRRGEDHAMLRARATKIGAWERFLLYRNAGTGKYSLLAKANSRWVSAEVGYKGRTDGMLRARSYKPGAWEQFTFS